MKISVFKKEIAMTVAAAMAIVSIGVVQVYSSQTASVRSYRIYNYGTESETGSYLLRHVTDDSVSTYTAFPPDERTEYDNSGVVFLGSSGSGGTGFIVDDHTIATAAHCVFNWDTMCYYQDMQITLYDDSGNVVKTVDASEAHIPYLYKNSDEDKCKNYDYALITVTEDLSNYEHFKLGQVLDGAIYYTPITVNVCGFPLYLYDENGNISDTVLGDLYIGQGTFRNFNDYRIWYSTDSSAGQSGGPVFVTSSYSVNGGTPVEMKTVVAINAYSGGSINGNSGTRLTSEIIQFYLNNSYNTYEE